MRTTQRKKRRSVLGLGSKKGNAVLDSLIVLITLFVFAIMIIIGNNLSNDLTSEIQASDDYGATAKQISSDFDDKYPPVFDAAFVFFLVLFWIIALIASFFIDVHPIFLVFSILLIIVILFVGVYMGNTFEDLVTDTDLASGASDLPMLMFIMSHLVETILAIVTTLMIALYAKSRQD